MWHTACSSSLPGEVVIFGGCATSVLSPEPVNSHNLKLIYLKLVILQNSSICGDSFWSFHIHK